MTATEPCREHQLHPHYHGSPGDRPPWCSARFWCSRCLSWVGGSPCKGARSALPSLPGASRSGES
jgi:hypothetical protein